MKKSAAYPYLRSCQLKALHDTGWPESRYFDRDTMRFIGDTMANYGVRPARMMTPVINGVEQPPRMVYELYRRKPVTGHYGTLTASAYFDAETFEKVFVKPQNKV